MNIICFPFERVIEINVFMLNTELGISTKTDQTKDTKVLKIV